VYRDEDPRGNVVDHRSHHPADGDSSLGKASASLARSVENEAGTC
jgi:hypothetical protein